MTSRMTHQVKAYLSASNGNGDLKQPAGTQTVLGIKTMNMDTKKLGSFLVSLSILMAIACPAWAQTTYNYTISLDSSGDKTSGGGSGYSSSWYYYPTADMYIMWFYNGPYDADSSITLELGATISPASTLIANYTYNTKYCWSTASWSSAGDTTPPLPSDVQDSTTFSKYISQSIFFSGTRSSSIGSISYSDQYKTINSYNPAWIGFMVSGTNATIAHSIIIGAIEDPDDDDDPTGACCNQSTGDCTITTMANCSYTWLGEGTTCSSCQATSALYDYGDAPSYYPVLSSDNGAKHYAITGFCLGSDLTAESDGQPSTGASLDDDDGVTFATDLTPGSLATIYVTTTNSLGSLNAWLDFNGDGDWADSDEQIISDVQLSSGTNTLVFQVPSTAEEGTTYARFRYSTNTGLSYTGTATDGEVEDYLVVIQSSSNSDTPTLPFGAHLPNRLYSPITSQIPLILDTEDESLFGYACGSLYEEGPIIADDWVARDGLPVIGLRWWGVFDDWTDASLPSDYPAGFHIAIWSHNSTQNTPKKMLWEMTVTDPAVSNAGIIDNSNVDATSDLPTQNTVCFEFATLFSQEDWFYPSQTDATYWISISAIYDETPTYTWSWLSASEDTGETAQQILATTYSGVDTWPPTLGCIVDTDTIVSNEDVSFEIISSEENPSSDLYDGWLGDLNGDGVADEQDFEDLIKLFVF